MLARIDPAVLPALRIAETFFFLIYLGIGAYLFRNRRRFFDRDPNESAEGRFFLLSTASLSALSYEHNLSQPAIRLWDDDRHVND